MFNKRFQVRQLPIPTEKLGNATFWQIWEVVDTRSAKVVAIRNDQGKALQHAAYLNMAQS